MNRRLLSSILLLTIMVSTSGSFGANFEMGRKALNQGDYATALKEWNSLAEQGDARAQTVMGLMYTNGIGAPRDDVEAVKWFRLAANQGYAQAQYNLGLMYAVGLGVSQDDTEAVKWYRLAAVQGYVKAKNALKITEPKLAQQSKKKLFKAEEEAQLKAEEEARLKAEKEAQIKAEKAARLKAKKVARLRAEREAQLKALKVARLRVEKAARLKAEKVARLKAEKAARLKAEKAARLKSKEEARLKAAVEKQRLAAIEESVRLEGNLTTNDKKLIQIGLEKSGFPIGFVDGVFGADTRKKIRAYQLSLLQDATGFLDADQLASLKAIGQSAEEALPPEKDSQTGEGFSLFGITIIPAENPPQTDR